MSTVLKAGSAIQIRPFTKEDWYGFAGAEGEAHMVDLPEGHALLNPPKPMETKAEMYFTIDNNGIYVMWMGEGMEEYQQYGIDLQNLEMGKKLVADWLTVEMTHEEFKAKFTPTFQEGF